LAETIYRTGNGELGGPETFDRVGASQQLSFFHRRKHSIRSRESTGYILSGNDISGCDPVSLNNGFAFGEEPFGGIGADWA